MTTGRIDQIITRIWKLPIHYHNMISTTIFNVSIATYMASVYTNVLIYYQLTTHTI